MRVLSLVAVAAACISSAVAAKSSDSVLTYTVSCQTTYVVQNGDTCSKIGKAFNILTSKIKKYNPSINAGCTNLYIDQILCLSAPTTQSSAVAVGTTSATKTATKTATTANVATTVLTMAGPQCQSDDDCAGIRCCNLFTNQCVLDPNDTICDIAPPKTTTAKATTTTGKATTTGKTATKTTTTSASSATCYPGSYGIGNGDGYSGYCCKTEADCLDDCISGKCNGPVNSKTTAITATATATNTKTTTTKTVTTTSVTAVPTGLTVQISSSTDFCIFLPPSSGNKANNGGKQDVNAIADSEKYAVAFCARPNVNAPGAGLFPSGFITSAQYQTNSASGFVQVRGTIDVSKYGLSSQDQGGQYDNHGSGSPPKSVCAGYPYYVNLVEPNTGDFCIRCCESYSDCNAGRSAYGCDRVVPAL